MTLLLWHSAYWILAYFLLAAVSGYGRPRMEWVWDNGQWVLRPVKDTK